MVFACVSALPTCLGLMRLPASRSSWLPVPAFVFVLLCMYVCARAKSQSNSPPDTWTGQQFYSVRTHDEEIARKNGCAC